MCYAKHIYMLDENNNLYEPTEVVLKEGITKIGNYQFKNFTSLVNIVIPTSVTSIGDYAFRGCTNLTSIEIPNSVTYIGFDAFEGCTSLTIYCEADSKPSKWEVRWNPSNCPVVWGYKK